jgi:regulator of protease activity HflC (stomatin/prohibitin superfamily)
MAVLLTVLISVAFLLMVEAAASLRVVQQYEQGVLFRLGRLLGRPTTPNRKP